MIRTGLKGIIKFKMLLCLCHGVSEREVERVIAEGADSVEAVGGRCGAGTSCGACLGEIADKVAACGGGGADGDNPCPGRCGDSLVSVRSAGRTRRREAA